MHATVTDLRRRTMRRQGATSATWPTSTTGTARVLTARILACVLVSLFAVLLFSSPIQAQGLVDPLRGPTPIGSETRPPPIFPVENKDVRRTRAFTMQPPTIPHKIDGYQLDRDFNRCMFCHARTRIEETQAIPVSVTHYMDRNNNVIADVSPRRYFCTQCHVPQSETKVLIPNRFTDVETLLKREAAGKSNKKN